MTPDKPALSIVIAAHNEAGNIEPLLAEIMEVFGPGEPPEVIVVDDGSTDATAAGVRRAAARWPGIRLLRHRQKSGQSAALWTGIWAARADWAAMLDGDGQNDPRDLLRLWRQVQAEPPAASIHMFAGRRQKRNDGAVKWLSSRAANWIRRTVLKDGTHDTGCGLKLFRRDAYIRLPYFDTMHRYLPALIRRGGGTTVEVAVDDRPRLKGRSKYGFFDRLADGLWDLPGVFWLCRRARFPDIEPSE
jgi:dolichol-phosphate mannosyltransferase